MHIHGSVRLHRTALTAVFALGALVTPVTGQVRAKEPTTVTVEGRQERVEPQATERKPQRKAGVAGAMKTAAGKTWNGLVSFSGWLLNTSDDIPSPKEQDRDRKASERK